jgi:prolyl 4-hydroxylase
VHTQANLTRVPRSHFEPTQLVEYQPGQYYKMHSDYLGEQADNPRVYTLLVYLTGASDGGETVFKYAGPEGKMLFVAPKPGRALLWPNTLDSNPRERDPQGAPLSHPPTTTRLASSGEGVGTPRP